MTALLCFYMTTAAILSTAASAALETYLVHAPAHAKPSLFASPHAWHSSLLAAATGGAPTEERMLYSYATTLQGFAARLTPQEVAKLKLQKGVSMAIKDRPNQLHTTRTPAFLGLSSSTDWGLWNAANQGEDVIVGVLDTGIWPERPSFSNDTGFSAIPSRWNGTCESAPTFNASLLCNRKLIGARAFYKGYESSNGPINETLEYKSARDSEGHGTHTSSTATGNIVANASLEGYATGTASGMAPLARLAMYKVCWATGCFDSDLLAGFEAAISDGVDVISLSVGSKAVDYYNDMIAIGSFAAVANGIITSCSAGNSGPGIRTVTNVAPWIFTIAASSIDRVFPAPAVIGNGQSYRGESLYSGGDSLGEQQVPLIYAGEAVVKGGNVTLASFCGDPTLLDSNLVMGKVVLCDRGGGSGRALKGYSVKQAGGAGMILGNDEASGEDLIADSHLLPATIVGHQEAVAIKQYINSTANATVHIDFQGTQLGVKPAPVMTAFSSRGPNPITAEILKPDITAPGLNILAGWTGFVGPTDLPQDTRDVDFNIISGTSMSCPHVAGITALLKSAHPTWSPAAIRSALMTTANTNDNAVERITDSSTGAATNPTVYGAGHVNPNGALYPGLVFDISTQDYIDFLCSLNYTGSMMSVFVSAYNCSGGSSNPGDLNYPSITAVYHQNMSSTYTQTFTRTATNVGPANSSYTAFVKQPDNVTVSVQPSTLSFQSQYQKLSYSVTFSADSLTSFPEGIQEVWSFGSLNWLGGGHHIVRSPITFMRLL